MVGQRWKYDQMIIKRGNMMKKLVADVACWLSARCIKSEHEKDPGESFSRVCSSWGEGSWGLFGLRKNQHQHDSQPHHHLLYDDSMILKLVMDGKECLMPPPPFRFSRSPSHFKKEVEPLLMVSYADSLMLFALLLYLSLSLYLQLPSP